MTRRADVDVIVVGGGPVGMLLAAELAMLDIDTVVVEANGEPVDQPRAGTMHARTVQSLVRRGFVEADVTADPHRHITVDYPYAGMPGLMVRAPATEGPPVLSIPQLALEQMFEARAVAVGAEVLREHRVTAVSAEADGVSANVMGPDGAVRIDASYLVGADGARSVVRQQVGFANESHAATLDALIALVPVLDPDSAPLGWNRTPVGWTRIDANWSGRCRVMTFDFSGPADDRRAPVTLDELQETFARIAGTRIALGEPTFLGRFSDYSRLVTEYRRGRVLLAGDAAHVHFPIGGQGLNLGIQDALNLGWKLAAAIKSGGSEALLDSYHAERHPAAQRVLDSTRAQVALMQPDPAHEPVLGLFRELLALDSVARHLGDRVSGQDIRHARDGATAGDFQTNVLLHTDEGDVAVAQLLGAARPLLVVLSGADEAVLDVARRWSARVTTVVATCDHELPWRSALIRPDGYLAWTATDRRCDTGQLAGILGEWFAAPGDRTA
jgi:2-polyprenyl-6-methoxyphenol hydroxylase-like FAD-dependent oxidoreductase